jgi:hypothetical protein
MIDVTLFCHVLWLKKSLTSDFSQSVHPPREKITQKCEYQEEGNHWKSFGIMLGYIYHKNKCVSNS